MAITSRGASCTPRRRSARLAAGAMGIALVAACSTRKIAYDMMPRLIVSAIDRELELTTAQREALRPQLTSLQAWHRSEELSVYADRIDELRDRLSRTVTIDEMRWMRGTTEGLVERVAERIAPALGDLLASLTPRQIARLGKMAEAERKEVAKLAALSPERFAAERTKKDEKGLSKWVGDLTPAQRALLTEHNAKARGDVLARKTNDAAVFAALAEKVRAHERAADLAREARRLLDGSAGKERAPDLMARLQANNEAFAVTLVASMTAAQRQHLDKELRAWRDDFLELAGKK